MSEKPTIRCSVYNEEWWPVTEVEKADYYSEDDYDLPVDLYDRYMAARSAFWSVANEVRAFVALGEDT